MIKPFLLSKKRKDIKVQSHHLVFTSVSMSIYNIYIYTWLSGLYRNAKNPQKKNKANLQEAAEFAKRSCLRFEYKLTFLLLNKMTKAKTSIKPATFWYFPILFTVYFGIGQLLQYIGVRMVYLDMHRPKVENVLFWRATRCQKLLKNAKNHSKIVKIWPFL